MKICNWISIFLKKFKKVLEWIPLLIFIANLIVFGWKPQSGPLRFLFQPTLDKSSCHNEKIDGNDGKLFIYNHSFKIDKPLINLRETMRLNFFVPNGRFHSFVITSPSNIPKSAITPMFINESNSTENVTVFLNFIENKFELQAKIIIDRRLTETECIIEF